MISAEQLKSSVAKWILKHREGHRIPHSVMESIVLGAQSLFQLSTSGLQHSIIEVLKQNNVPADVISHVTTTITDQSDIFRGLASTYQQNEYIKANFHYVVSIKLSNANDHRRCFVSHKEPVHITFGVRHIPGKFLRDGSLKQIKESMIYIPILNTIEHLLSNDTILAEVRM